MKPHKWAKEIKAWADGAEIESKHTKTGEWLTLNQPYWYEDDEYEYRIKPTPKEPQYLYVFADLADWEATRTSVLNRKKDYETYIGKIELEGDENE